MGTLLRSEPEEYYKEYREDISVAEYEDEWELERRRYSASLRAMKERDKELVRIANDKLRRAREKGKGRASLSQDEIEALERRRLHEKNADRRVSSSKSSSRNASSLDLQIDKTRRKSSRVASSPVSGSPRSTSKTTRSSPKGSRTASLDRQEPLPYPDSAIYSYAPATQSDPVLYHRSASDAYPPRDSSLRHFSQETVQRVSSAPRYPPAETLSPARVRAATLTQPPPQHSNGRRFVSGPEFSSKLRRVSPSPGPSPVREVPAYFDSDASADSVVVVSRRSSGSEGDSTPRRKDKDRRRKKR